MAGASLSLRGGIRRPHQHVVGAPAIPLRGDVMASAVLCSTVAPVLALNRRAGQPGLSRQHAGHHGRGDPDPEPEPELMPGWFALL